MDSFCKRYLFVDSRESTNEGRSTSDLQNLPIFNWSPGERDNEPPFRKKWKNKKVLVSKDCAGMIQEKDREWRERLQKEELLQAEDILEKYGIAYALTTYSYPKVTV
jgi:hypothetical protein